MQKPEKDEILREGQSINELRTDESHRGKLCQRNIIELLTREK